MKKAYSLFSVESLSDHELLAITEVCAQEERSATMRLLAHLREVEKRKLYCDLKQGSLHAYCHKILRMSEGSAQRRICVLKLSAVLPEVFSQVESGELSLTTAARLQSYFQKEEKLGSVSLESKRELAQAVAGKSKREVETLLRKHSKEPDQHQPESIRVISEGHVRLSFALRQEELLILDRARGLLAHKFPEGLSLQELVVAMARQTITTLDPAERKPTRRSASPPRGVSPIDRQVASPPGGVSAGDRQTASSPGGALAPDCHPASPLQGEVLGMQAGAMALGNPDSRVPGVVLKHVLWKRDQSKCRNCGTHYRVQVEHDQPWALGGSTSLDNAHLLCRNCNLRAAIRRFGLGKIRKEQVRTKTR